MNLTTNASDFVYIPPFTDAGVILSALIIIPLSLFGALANILTIFVIYNSPKLKSMFNYFIMSLCVSDLVSALISPLFLYRRTWGFEYWAASDFMCKMFWGLDLWTSCVTSTHILCFALLRFVSVQWPHRFNAIKAIHAKITILIIYVVTFLVGFLPFVLWFGASKRDRSSSLPNAKWPSCTLNFQWLSQFKLYTQLGYSLLFFVPIFLVIVLSVGIIFKIIQMRKMRERMISKANDGELTVESKRRRKEHQIMLQLGLIVGSFLVGYVPHAVFHYWTVNVVAVTNQQRVVDWWFGSIEYFCLRLSECLNPVFYNLASSKMRKETKRTLSRMCATVCSCSAIKPSQFTTSAVTSSTGSPNNMQL